MIYKVKFKFDATINLPNRTEIRKLYIVDVDKTDYANNIDETNLIDTKYYFINIYKNFDLYKIFLDKQNKVKYIRDKNNKYYYLNIYVNEFNINHNKVNLLFDYDILLKLTNQKISKNNYYTKICLFEYSDANVNVSEFLKKIANINISVDISFDESFHYYLYSKIIDKYPDSEEKEIFKDEFKIYKGKLLDFIIQEIKDFYRLNRVFSVNYNTQPIEKIEHIFLEKYRIHLKYEKSCLYCGLFVLDYFYKYSSYVPNIELL